MMKVKEVQVQPGYKLALRFSDGTKGTADLRSLVSRRPFQKLRDADVFAQAHLDHGAVEWPGEIGIATEALYAMAHGLPKPETLEQAWKNELQMSLRELRELAGSTQNEVAGELEMDQGQLSRFERQDDRLLSTLRRYVEALGGELEVTAVLGDKRITLRGV